MFWEFREEFSIIYCLLTDLHLEILFICMNNIFLYFCNYLKLALRMFSSVQLLSCVRLFATPWTAACQASLSITNSQSLLKLMSIESVMPSNHLIFCWPLSSCLQSFPASGSFPVSQLFTSGGQCTRTSASDSILPMRIQSCFL